MVRTAPEASPFSLVTTYKRPNVNLHTLGSNAVSSKRYTHKTSDFKTSGFKTSGFITSGFKTSETSGLQNVRFTKRQVYKTSGLQNIRFTKRQVFKTSSCKKTSINILYLWLVEIRRLCCSHVCRQSDGCVFFLQFLRFFCHISP
jgi:hypothetical protein